MTNLLQFMALFLGAYLGLGTLVGIGLVGPWLKRLDPRAARAGLAFRLVIFPGMTLLWPVMALRCLRNKVAAPTVHSPHPTLET